LQTSIVVEERASPTCPITRLRSIFGCVEDDRDEAVPQPLDWRAAVCTAALAGYLSAWDEQAPRCSAVAGGAPVPIDDAGLFISRGRGRSTL
jgi:hypothetical protein